MKNKKSILLFILVLVLVVLAAVFFTLRNKPEEKILRVGATPVPHAEILEFIKPILADKGIEMEIVEFTDYVTPNMALDEGSIDANFFQHLPYLESFNRDHNLE